MASKRRVACSDNYQKISNKKSKPTRGLGWSDEETECLLSIWGENNIEEQLEDSKVNKGSVYEMISTEMENQGHTRTKEQCKIRMHTLKRSFWDCKKKLKTSGKGRKLCNFFDQLNEILGQRPASSPVKLVESMRRRRKPAIPEDEETDDDDGDTDNTQNDEGRLTDDDGNTGYVSEPGSAVDSADDAGERVQTEVMTHENEQTEGENGGNVGNVVEKELIKGEETACRAKER